MRSTGGTIIVLIPFFDPFSILVRGSDLDDFEFVNVQIRLAQ